MQAFKINDEFVVSPGNNQLTSTLKLEPRLMKLLCLLAANPGKLVTRDEIIEKIWNGYGGGDEGLTQAISFLRKALNDNDKQVIETVPKGGYIFRGRIAPMDEPADTSGPVKMAGYLSIKAAALGAAVLLVIFTLAVYLLFLNRERTPQPDREAPKPPQGSYAPKAR